MDLKDWKKFSDTVDGYNQGQIELRRKEWKLFGEGKFSELEKLGHANLVRIQKTEVNFWE